MPLSPLETWLIIVLVGLVLGLLGIIIAALIEVTIWLVGRIG